MLDKLRKEVAELSLILNTDKFKSIGALDVITNIYLIPIIIK
jgi:hypothetical protein